MALIGEDNYFNTRLHEINDEMQRLLDRTSRQRDDVLRPSRSPHASTTSPDVVRTGAAPSDTRMPASFVALGPLERAFVEQEMRQLCREEMQRWMATDFPKMVTQAVEREVERRLADVLRTTEKMQDNQDATAAAMAALQKEWKETQRQLHLASQQVETHQHHAESTIRAEMERYVSGWRTDMDLMKDTISTVERQAQLLEQREEKRVAELARQHLNVVRDKLAALSNEVESWKTELYSLFRQEVKTWREQRVELDMQIARFDGAQRVQVDTVARHAATLTNLLEGSVEQRAEMRRCRRDVNRLEMLVQCVGVSEGGAAQIERVVRAESPQTPPQLPSTSVVQELFATKDRLAFLAGHVEAMERRLHQVDHYLLQTQPPHMNTHPGSVSSSSPAGRDPLQAMHASWDGATSAWPTHGAQRLAGTTTAATAVGVDTRSQAMETVMMGSNAHGPVWADGRPPDGGNQATESALPPRQAVPQHGPAEHHPQRADVDRPMPTSVTGARGGSAMESQARRGYMGADARPFSQRRPPPVVLPASSGSDLSEHEQAGAVEKGDGDSYVSETPASQGRGGRFSFPLVLTGSQRPGSRPGRGETSPSQPARELEAAASATPHDSYMSALASNRGSPVPSQSAVSREQYTPAPGSDTESEISNQKLSRLALD